MADLTITIPAPSLTTGQYFKVRYRQLPGGAWGSYSNRSNAAFTITGLSIGDYEFEFILVNADETQCPPVYRTYTLVGDYDCITFASEMKKVNNLYHIEIAYTLPPGHTDPACGWEVEYIQNSTSNKFTYANLPASGIIKIPCPNVAAILYVRALMCNNRVKQCHVNDVANFINPPCVPFSGVTINITEVRIGSKCEYYLDINFTQSVPATTQVRLVYNQWHRGLSMGDSFNGMVAISPTATTFRRKLNPLFYEGDECTTYYVSFIDVCGNGSVTQKDFCRTNCFNATP